MNMLLPLLLVAPVLLSPVTVTAARADADKIDAYITEQMRKRNIPGLSFAVVKEGQILKAKGYGFSNVELGVLATVDTVYEIGSVTKQFTATAVMMLVEKGKVSLDDKISKHVSGTPDTWKDVTVRHLLTHTSGIKPYTSVPDFPNLTILPTTHEGVIKMMASYPLEFQPGEKWDYSNTGYYLLGVIIEKVSGQSYADFLNERIFTPLQMTSTRVNNEKTIIPRRASGYSWSDGTLRHADAISMTWPYAAGALVSTVTDMAKWDAALYTEHLLKKSSLDAMWTRPKLKDGTTSDYGFGWFVSEIRGHRALLHGGGIPGFETFMCRFPNERWMVVVLTNQDGMADPASISNGIMGHYNLELASPRYTSVEDKEPQMTAKVKHIFEQAALGTVDTTLFTPEQAAVATAQNEPLKAILQNLGSLQSISLVERKNEKQNRLYRYRLVYERASALVLCVINPEGKIAGVTIAPE